MFHNPKITKVMQPSSTYVIETLDNLGDNPQSMSVGERIKAERERRGMSQADLGRLVGISQPAIKKIEDGDTVKSKYLHEILAALGLAEGTTARQTSANGGTAADPEFFDKNNKMPVYTSAEGGEGELIVDTDPIDWVERPYTLAHVKKAYAIVVTGDSMHPAYKPGDKAWVNPQLAPLGGDDCVILAKDHALGEMRVLIKEFVRSTSTHWILRQYNPPKDLKLSKVEWQRCFKVVGKFHRG